MASVNDDSDSDMDDLVFEPPSKESLLAAAALRTSNANTSAASRNGGTQSKFDADGDIVMDDLDTPEAIQSVSDAVVISRHMNRGKEGSVKRQIPGQRIANPSAVLCLDTSFILSHLKLVSGLVDAHAKYRNVIVVPWTTILELDGISKGDAAAPAINVTASSGLAASRHSKENRQIHVSRLARQAIGYINDRLAQRDPGVWCQKLDEKVDESGMHWGDDSILDCARYFKEKLGFDVIMLSNDRNLCLKSMAHTMHAVSYKAGLTAEKLLEEHHIFPVPVKEEASEPVAVPTPPPSYASQTWSEPATQLKDEWLKPAAPSPSASPAPVAAPVAPPIAPPIRASTGSPSVLSGASRKPARPLGLADSKWASPAWKNQRKPDRISFTPPPQEPPAEPAEPVVDPQKEARLKADLYHFLNQLCMPDDILGSVIHLANLYVKSIGVDAPTLTTFTDVEAIVSANAPTDHFAHLHRAFRDRLAAKKYSIEFTNWLAWCVGNAQPDVAPPDEWAIRGWLEDVAKLWKILFGPVMMESTKKAINELISAKIKEVSDIFAGKARA